MINAQKYTASTSVSIYNLDGVDGGTAKLEWIDFPPVVHAGHAGQPGTLGPPLSGTIYEWTVPITDFERRGGCCC